MKTCLEKTKMFTHSVLFGYFEVDISTSDFYLDKCKKKQKNKNACKILLLCKKCGILIGMYSNELLFLFLTLDLSRGCLKRSTPNHNQQNIR